MYIRPTIGRMVWYRPLPANEQLAAPPTMGHVSDGYVTAQVVSVEHEGEEAGPAIVNLVVHDRFGVASFRNQVVLRHDLEDEHARCEPGQCRWMPFQQGQARAQTPEQPQPEGPRGFTSPHVGVPNRPTTEDTDKPDAPSDEPQAGEDQSGEHETPPSVA